MAALSLDAPRRNRWRRRANIARELIFDVGPVKAKPPSAVASRALTANSAAWPL
jgi:hypothetical protein